MGSEDRSRTIHGNKGALIGPFWFAGWLFTITFAKLAWWKALLALIVWPYFLGVAAR